MPRSLIRAVCWAVLLVPLVVSSTPPAIWWDLYVVPGYVEPEAGSAAGHTVVLSGYSEDAGWEMLGQCTGQGAESVMVLKNSVITPETGHFQLAVAVCHALDSLAVAVVYPDSVIMGEAFAVGSVKPEVVTKTGHKTDTSLCEDDEYTYEDGNVYRYPAKTVPVP